MGILLLASWLLASAPQAGRIKLIADQDSAGPHGTNFLSLLMLLLAPEVDLLGITTVSGDQWVAQETLFALSALELTGRSEVPVVMGARTPLLNNSRDQEAREALYGSHATWHGAFNPDAPPPEFTWPPPGGYPRLKPRPGHAAGFIVETIRKHPGEVVIYAAGPLTNIALAVRLDPGIVELTRALYVMGGSSTGGWELNWWWDPEAAAIVIREPWRELVVTTGEAGAQVWSNERMMRRIAEAGGRLSGHVRSLYLDFRPPPGTSIWSMMWDELSVATLVEPSVVKRWETLHLDVVIDHGAKYGHTLVWRKPEDVPHFFLPHSGPGGVDRSKWVEHLSPPFNRHPARVPAEVDIEKLEEFFVRLMSR
jgi:inosine-uridine nucleoside N-ribohydrolase